MSQPQDSTTQAQGNNEPALQNPEDQAKHQNLEHLDYVELEENYDPNHEPTEDQIIEYAKFLGMNLPEDNEFLPIAKKGLKSPLPPNWKPCHTAKKELIYVNSATGESQWHHPCDDICKAEYLAGKQAKKQPKSEEPKKEEAPKTPFNRALYALLDDIADLKGGLAKLEDVAFQAVNKDYDGVPSELLDDLLLDFDELYLNLSNAFSGSSSSYENLKLVETLNLEAVSAQIRQELHALKNDIRDNISGNRNVHMMIVLERLFQFHAIINSERELAQYIILREPNLVNGLIDKTATRPSNIIALDTPLISHDILLAQSNSVLNYPSYYINRLDDILYNLNHLLDLSLLARRLLLQSKAEIREDIINAFYKAIPPRTIIKGNPYSMKSDIHRQIDDLKFDLYSIDRRAAALGRYRYPYPDDQSLAYDNLEKLQQEAKQIGAKLDKAFKNVDDYANQEANVVDDFIKNARNQIKNLLSDSNEGKYNLKDLANELLDNLKKSLNKEEKQEQKEALKPVEEKQEEKAEEKPVDNNHHEEVADEEAIEPPKNIEKQAEATEVKKEETVPVNQPETVVESTPIKAKEGRVPDTTAQKSSASTDFTNPSGNKADNLTASKVDNFTASKADNFTASKADNFTASKADTFNTPSKRAFDAGSPLIGNHYRNKSQGAYNLSNYELNKNYLDYMQRIQRSSPKRNYYY